MCAIFRTLSDPQILPLRYEIDYVRHYQKKNQAAE